MARDPYGDQYPKKGDLRGEREPTYEEGEAVLVSVLRMGIPGQENYLTVFS